MTSETAEEILAQIDRQNAINCTGIGEVGCHGREGWHSWREHRRHVAEAQVAALVRAGLMTAHPTPEPAPVAGGEGERRG